MRDHPAIYLFAEFALSICSALVVIAIGGGNLVWSSAFFSIRTPMVTFSSVPFNSLLDDRLLEGVSLAELKGLAAVGAGTAEAHCLNAGGNWNVPLTVEHVTGCVSVSVGRGD